MKINFKKIKFIKSSRVRSLSLFVLLCLMALSCVFVSTSANADEMESWGPQDRATFTWQEPADYVTFNSITDNPLVGDERNFVRVRKADTTDIAEDNIDLEIGQEYEVVIWFHNNAKSSLNKLQGTPGAARNARVMIEIPEHVGANGSAVIKGTISADNANPQAVWDMAFGNTGDTAVLLHYVPNSAVVHLNEPGEYDEAKGGYYHNGYQTTEGQILNADALFGKDGYGGAKIGYYNDQWGSLPGCSEYSGYIQLRFVVDQPNFEMYKTVSREGANDYVESISAEPGEILDFKIEYKNTGTTYQDDVVAKDVMPEGLTYVEGSTYFESNRIEKKNVYDDLFDPGLLIGDFAPGDSATITYQARVEDNPDLFPCGDTVIYNDGAISTQNGTGYDKAEITVSRTCDCVTNPELPGCQELPSTGPVEVAIATLIIAGIGGTGYYFYRTKKNLKTIESSIYGGESSNHKSRIKKHK